MMMYTTTIKTKKIEPELYDMTAVNGSTVLKFVVCQDDGVWFIANPERYDCYEFRTLRDLKGWISKETERVANLSCNG